MKHAFLMAAALTIFVGKNSSYADQCDVAKQPSSPFI
jgi:hypothetical protein